MADMNQLKRAVVELENGVQWMKALTEVGELKEETREQFEQLIDTARQLQKQQEQAQIAARISSEENRQQQNNVLSSLADNLAQIQTASSKQHDERSEYLDKLKSIEQSMLTASTENTDKLLERHNESSNAAVEQIIASMSLQLKENAEQINSQLAAYSEMLEETSKKLRRRIALNRWLTLGYAVIMLTLLVLFKYVL